MLTQNVLKVHHQQIPLSRLTPEYEGFRIAHLSDLHFYEHTSLAFYDEVVRQCQAENPDMIVMTGDVIHFGSRYIGLAKSYLSQLEAPCGKLAVIGNHDFLDDHGSEAVAKMLVEAGFIVLRNQVVPLGKPGCTPLWWIGLDDLKYGRPNIPETLAKLPEKPVSENPVTIALTHNPLLYDPLAHTGQVDLVLAGHTHGGHVYIPPLYAIYRHVFQMKYRYGLYEKYTAPLYVTSGVGSAAFYYYQKPLELALPRFRFNTHPEIALLELVCGV